MIDVEHDAVAAEARAGTPSRGVKARIADDHAGGEAQLERDLAGGADLVRVRAGDVRVEERLPPVEADRALERAR